MCRPTRDLSGKRFGRLQTQRLDGKNRKGDKLWECLCDCGNTVHVPAYNLTTGNTTSCGCFHKEVVSKQFSTHGKSFSRTYRIWGNMIQRCTNPKNHKWPIYGGRGICVCDRWRNSFSDFLSDMGECPPRLSIDRINNDGNYEPGNCRWATIEQQANNRRPRRRVA